MRASAYEDIVETFDTVVSHNNVLNIAPGLFQGKSTRLEPASRVLNPVAYRKEVTSNG
jgi:hypothetical protein